MKKRIYIVCFLLVIVGTLCLTSCASLNQLSQDPDFREGFRRGWNSTAPEEYRY